MHAKKLIPCLVLALVALPLAALSADQMNEKDPGWQGFKDKARTEFSEWHSKTEAYLGKAKAGAKKDYQAALANLNQAKAEAKQSYEELQAASAENWEKAKDKYNNALDKLKRAYDAAMAEMKK